MHPTRIAELLEPFVAPGNDRSRTALSEAKELAANNQRLTTNDLNRISTYIDLLLRWNARINLSAIRNPDEIVTRHFGESLFAAIHLFPNRTVEGHAARSIEADVGTAAPGCPPERSSATDTVDPENHPARVEQSGRAALQGRVIPAEDTGTLAPAGFANGGPELALGEARGPATNDRTAADLGSGAGFPGIPIKLWAPKISLTLIESNHKKATFLREVTRALTLTNVNILTARAEQVLHSTFAVVTLRAVERFANVLPVAASLVSPGGRLALLVGNPQIDQACSLLPNLTWDSPLPVPQSNSRTLLIGHNSQQ